MKKISNFYIIALLLVFAACEPIVDEQVLENTTDVEGVELVATQSTAGGNEITLNMTTPGITGYWDYNLGQALTNKVTFIYPIPGEATFTYVGTLGAEFFTKTVNVQIDELDHALDQDWYDLVSESTAEGKTWVFDGESGDEGLWWFMSPPNDAASWATAWWNAGGTCCPPPDAGGKMEFNLAGAANYVYYSGPDAEGQTGSFVLDVENQTLTVSGNTLLGGTDDRRNADGVYQIISLTEDELILYTPNNAGGTGWTWVFRPAE